MEISNELRKLVDPNNECCCADCLSNKCKEWALSKNYEIESSLFVDGNKKRIGYSQVLRKESPMLQKTADTEPEAIFKACEYILKELSNK